MTDTIIQDAALRAMTDDGGFRVITARTTDTVRGILKAQKVTGQEARTLADLVTGTILLRETMAPSLRIQGILQTLGSTMVADSYPEGDTRGLVQRPKRVAADAELLQKRAQLTMMRSLPNGSHQRGAVEVPEAGGLSAAMMEYMKHSEQVLGLVAMGAVFEGDEVVAAGGYVVQLTPELSEEMLATMTMRLHDFQDIEKILAGQDGTPERLQEELLYRMPYTRLADSPLRYKCRCDATRLLGSLATLPKAEIEGMIEAGETLEITCDYCQTDYRITVEQLRGVLDPS